MCSINSERPREKRKISNCVTTFGGVVEEVKTYKEKKGWFDSV